MSKIYEIFGTDAHQMTMSLLEAANAAADVLRSSYEHVGRAVGTAALPTCSACQRTSVLIQRKPSHMSRQYFLTLLSGTARRPTGTATANLPRTCPFAGKRI